MAETSFEAIPKDLQMEILLLLPLKSLTKCVLVSKKCASLIRDKFFRDEYLLRSMTKPRMLLIDYAKRGDSLFHSVYQEDKPLMHISLHANKEISKPIRGLISIRQKTKVMICNPGTKKFMTLSEIKAPKGIVIGTHFGYDEDTDVFKVLCVTRMDSDGANVYQILTVRSSEESWRQIDMTCEHDHIPVTQGLCKGGVLYYGALSNSDESLVVSFNVRFEKFTVTKLEVYIDFCWELVNYNREIALVNDSVFDNGISDSNGNGVFEMWVRNEFTGEWKSESIVIHGWKEAIGDMEFYFRGTIRTGELVFAQNYILSDEASFFVLYYDTVTHKFRKFEMEGEFEGCYYVRTFLDHVDSVQLI